MEWLKPEKEDLRFLFHYKTLVKVALADFFFKILTHAFSPARSQLLIKRKKWRRLEAIASTFCVILCNRESENFFFYDAIPAATLSRANLTVMERLDSFSFIPKNVTVEMQNLLLHFLSCNVVGKCNIYIFRVSLNI